jgi:hypothetical protein
VRRKSPERRNLKSLRRRSKMKIEMVKAKIKMRIMKNRKKNFEQSDRRLRWSKD